jgi:CelD/BcsL family acetyltransferase involved in cellulose biosynthesis
LNVVCVDPRIDPLWQQLIEGHPSCVFHTPGWIQALTDTYGWEANAYILLDERGVPTAGMHFCHFSDHKGERIISLPFSDYCDPLVETREQWDGLFAIIEKEGHSFFTRCLHNDIPLSDNRLTLAKRAKWHGMNLRADLETIWQGIDSSARRAVNKARREGVTIRVANEKADLRAFFEMHLKVRKYKYRLLAQPYSLLENIWTQFIETQNGALLLAVYQDTIIAGTFFLGWKDTFYYKFNASEPAYMVYRPSDLLIWEGIQYAKARGYDHLDFGLSDWDQEGLLQFKRKFMTTEKTISFLQCETRQELSPWQAQAVGLFPQLSALLTDPSVPDAVTEKAGEILYRFFV